MNMFNIRTDLAIESHEILNNNKVSGVTENIPGIEVETHSTAQVKVTKIKITTDEAASNTGKPKGNYITIETPKITSIGDSDLLEEAWIALSKQISSIANLKDNDVVLIIGLGNWNVTPDALGPKVVSKIVVTRHILQNSFNNKFDKNVRSVCAVSPGVLGITGIETFDIVKGIVEKVSPNLIIIIDALASRKMDRVSTTVQITDTGISPGSGVGNRRAELSQSTLGIPVIAIGVPTVIDAATMANDTIDYVIDSLLKTSKQDSEFYNTLKSLDRDTKYKIITEVLNPYIGNLIVTPKEIDEIIEKVSQLIANGINVALHNSTTLDKVLI